MRTLVILLILTGCAKSSIPVQNQSLVTSSYHSRSLGIGLVTPDLLQNFIEMPYHTTLEQQTRVGLAKKAISDAYNQGAGHITVLAPGFFPQSPSDVARGYNDLDLWQTNPALYWLRMDSMMNEISQYDMAIVIHGWEDLRIFASLTGETTRDIVTNPNSKSFNLYWAYWKEFLMRYQDFPNIEMYSGPNEMNLIADLDMVTRCTGDCSSVGNFSTDEMIAFTVRITELFHSITSKPIFSNMGLQRPAAHHLRLQPEWSQNGPDWTLDTQDEWMGNLLDITTAFDVADSHAYNGNDGTAMELFGQTGAGIVGLIALTMKSVGKHYFISEFGDSCPCTTQNRTTTQQVMQTLIDNNTLGGSIWGYEYYQGDDYSFQVDGTAVYDLIPGNYPAMFGLMQSLNSGLHILDF